MRRQWADRITLISISILLVFPAVLRAADDVPATGLPACEPATVGMDAQTLGQIQARMQEFVENKQVAGTVTLVARRGCVVHLQAVGKADIENDVAMKKDSLFAIASMTKPITATALMILQDAGKLSVQDPVAKYLPEFKNVSLKTGPPSRDITIFDAITHTSGIVGSQRTEKTLQETTQEIAARPLGFEPGSRWQYSPGLTVCGRIIEVVSGQSYEEFLQAKIFEPLKMTDTSFRLTPKRQKRLARVYRPSKDKKNLELATHWLIGDFGERAPNPSGGLISSAADLVRFYQMILNGGELDGRRIISKQAVEQMTQVQTGELTTGFTPGNGWGLGWCVVREPQGVTAMLSPGTCGHGGAFGTQGWIDPKREMIFVLMIQRTGFGNGDASDIRKAFQKTAVQAVIK